METGEQMALVEHLQNQAREYSGGITMADTGANTPSAFVIGSPIRPLLKIHNDGTVEADIADMPEAAKVLAEHVQMHMQQWAEAHRAAERATLQATVERQAAEIAEVRASAETVIQIAVAAATKAERARMIAAMREPDALERLLDAVTDVANIVSYDGYYEIDKESATNALDAALSAAAAAMEAGDAA